MASGYTTVFVLAVVAVIVALALGLTDLLRHKAVSYGVSLAPAAASSSPLTAPPGTSPPGTASPKPK
jgi:CHASE2 domain-containing sensor protein